MRQMTRAISLYNKYPQCSCKPWGQPHLIISNTGVGSDWVKRSADCPSLKSMQTLSQTRKMAKHQHDTKTQQPKKKQKRLSAKTLGLHPWTWWDFKKMWEPLLLRKFSRDLDEGVSNLGQRSVSRSSRVL